MTDQSKDDPVVRRLMEITRRRLEIILNQQQRRNPEKYYQLVTYTDLIEL